MKKYIGRLHESSLRNKLANNPAVVLYGPRQCGKSTLAGHVSSSRPDSLHLDLERPSDRAQLSDPEMFFRVNSRRLVCLDEIQRVPEIFPFLRGLLDREGRNGRLLLLGSASPRLLRQASESLAGRIGHVELAPFLPQESGKPLRTVWLRGGYPRSLLAKSEEASREWREDFLHTLAQRDLPAFGPESNRFPLERFIRVCAHYHGQIVNYSRIGSGLGLSYHTIQTWMDLLEETFLIRRIPSWSGNLKKRLVKSPKLYFRDSGLLHSLLGLKNMNDLLGHPVYGFSWEGLVVQTLLTLHPSVTWSFFRTATGIECDLVAETASRTVLFECKTRVYPGVERELEQAMDETGATRGVIVVPSDRSYPLTKKVTITGLSQITGILDG